MKGIGSVGGPVAWCVLAAMLFGASTPASKPLLNNLGPVLLSGLLYLGAAIAVAPWALRNLSEIGKVPRRSILRLLGAVVFGGVVGPILLLTGLEMASAASVALWLNLETVATAVLARLFFREHLGARTWLAVGLIVIASIALSGASIGEATPGLLIALACVAWGLDNNLTAVIDRFTPAQITFVKGLMAGLFNTSLGLWMAHQELAGGPVAGALGIGALAYGASILLYVAGAQQLGATRSQLIFSTAPAWGIALAWTALGEPIEGMQVLALGLMAVAVWIWQSENHAHVHSHSSTIHTHWHCHDDGHHDDGDHEHGEHGDSEEQLGWHSHAHSHVAISHSHAHRPDLHHRHTHS